MLTWGEHVDTFAEVGEVGPLVTQSGSANSDSLLCGSGGVGTGIPVVVTGSDGEVHARLDGLVDGVVQSQGLSTTQRHVGDGTLMPSLSGSSVLSLCSGELVSGLFSSPQNATNDVSHGTTSVGAQDLDGDEVDGLRNTVLPRTNGTGAVGPVTVSVFVDVILRDSLAPGGATFELDVIDVDTGVDDVNVDTLAAGRVVFVESKGPKSESLTMGDTRKTLEGAINNHATRPEHSNVPMEQSAVSKACTMESCST